MKYTVRPRNIDGPNHSVRAINGRLWVKLTLKFFIPKGELHHSHSTGHSAATHGWGVLVRLISHKTLGGHY
jgi:hypothetical protein